MKNQINPMEELHKVNLQMLCLIRDICNRHHLQYYIGMGTLLGAVKYKAFVPWDDDADILIPRSDYIKFLEIAPAELPPEVQLLEHSNCLDYYQPKARLVSDRVKIVFHGYAPPRIGGAWVDICPLDGIPSSKIEYAFHKQMLLLSKFRIGMANSANLQYNKVGRPFYERICLKIARLLNTSNLFHVKDEYKKQDALLMKYSDKESKEYLNFNSTFRFKNCFDKNLVYGDNALYELYGEKFTGPSNYDAYLKKLFGENYMSEEPDHSKRNRHMTEVIG